MTKQAVRVRNLSGIVLTEVDVGENVLVAITYVDRGKGDPRNIKAVVTGKEEHGYQRGIKDGILLALYTRNQFQLSDSNFIAIQSKNDMCIALVISPLTSLMRTQTQALNRKGIKAVYLKDITSPSNFEDSLTNLSLVDVKEGKIDIIFSSPESLIGHERKLLLDLAKKNFIKTVFVDEAHCIKKFGLPDKKKKKLAYRPCYGRLDEIRSLVGGHVPVVALTATATEETKAVIKKQLCMDNCSEIMVNPDKKNVTYWVHNLPSDDICTNFPPADVSIIVIS
ncbi:ATP-dependent DNA helicase RecQ-like [Mytilus edulis]|uniref:ATP-dependent DNA helicase RecQ-like n=1 Tax=Mytilus edulis TaxID=6550 RepID=UPI0039EF61BA